jgi:hypothetical protein
MTLCGNNLYQQGLAANLYANDNRGFYPMALNFNRKEPATSASDRIFWYHLLAPYAGGRAYTSTNVSNYTTVLLNRCPDWPQALDKGTLHYGWNAMGRYAISTANLSNDLCGLGFRNTDYNSPFGIVTDPATRRGGYVNIGQIRTPGNMFVIGHRALDGAADSVTRPGLYQPGAEWLGVTDKYQQLLTPHFGNYPFNMELAYYQRWAPPLTSLGSYVHTDGHVETRERGKLTPLQNSTAAATPRMFYAPWTRGAD